MEAYREFCLHFWKATRALNLYSIDGHQFDKLIVDALSKTNGGKELIKTSMNELSVLIRAINHNNRKIQQPSLPSNLDEAAKEIAYNVCKQLPNGEEKDNIVYYAILAAKAGAEWMAEQGETQEHFVIGTIADSPCGPAIVCYTDEFEIGDKVIVQIRKKY